MAETGGHKPATTRRVEGQISRYLEPHLLGRSRLTTVQEDDVKHWAAWLRRPKADGGRGLSVDSARLVLRMLKAIFNAAVRNNKMLAPSPAFTCRG